MTGKELRLILKEYNQKELIDIILELYKRVPKKKKIEHDIDAFIKHEKKDIKKEPQTFEELEKEIETFLFYVDSGYYESKNDFVSQKERSNWRLKVKKYYKILCSIDSSSKEGSRSTTLLIEIYKRLSEGSNYLLFVNFETFRALGVSQEDYYAMLLDRLLTVEKDTKTIEVCCDLLMVPKDPYGSNSNLQRALQERLKSEEERNDAISCLKRMIEELKQKQKEEKNSHKLYCYESDSNFLTIMVLILYIVSKKEDKGISFYHKNYQERFSEVKEYILLEQLEEYQCYDAWIKEYESKKINYRDSLKEKYKKFKK